MKKKIIIAFVVISTLISCNGKNKAASEDEKHEEHEHHSPKGIVVLNKNQLEALSLKLDTFKMRNLTTVVKSNGELEVPPSSSADITAIIGGNVKEIKVFHGDKVIKGQLLAILEHPDYISLQEDFAKIANNLEYLKQEFSRQKELFENKIGAGKDFQQVKAEFNTVKAKYGGLKSRLQLLNLSPEKVMEGNISKTITITSPINGFVNEINVKVGTYVDTKNKLFSISDNSAIHADFMVYEKDVHLVKEGQKVHFTVSNLPEKELIATVFAIGKEFESNTRGVHVHAKIKDKVTNLIPGMYISCRLHINEKYTQALPNDAIVTEGTKSFIFIMDEAPLKKVHNNPQEKNNTKNKVAFKMVEIIPGLKDDRYTEVKLIKPLPKNTKVVMNVAYYLLADMKKKETEHKH